MNTDVVIIGAGPAGIFTALEMIRNGSHQKIVMVEKGQAVENRRCPKSKTGRCVNCKPYCHITTGFSGAGAAMASFSLMERYFSYPHGKSRICPFSSSQMRVANLFTK